MNWYAAILYLLLGSGLLSAFLLAFDEFMTAWQLARDMNLRLTLDYPSMGLDAIWHFMLGLLVLPTIGAIFVTGPTLVRFLWTGEWRPVKKS